MSIAQGCMRPWQGRTLRVRVLSDTHVASVHCGGVEQYMRRLLYVLKDCIKSKVCFRSYSEDDRSLAVLVHHDCRLVCTWAGVCFPQVHQLVLNGDIIETWHRKAHLAPATGRELRQNRDVLAFADGVKECMQHGVSVLLRHVSCRCMSCPNSCLA